MALGKWVMQEFTGWKGLTRENHISAAFGSHPQMASNVYIRLMEQKHGKNLESYLNRFPVKYFEEDSDIVWKLIGSARKNVALYEARDSDGVVVTESSGMIGKNTTPFYLVFTEDWFADGEVVVGELNEIYPLKIEGDPKMEGNLVVYKVELMGGVLAGMPADQLLPGKRFSQEYAPVGKTMTRKVGDIRFSTPISMRNEFSRIRKQHKVPGNLLNKKLMTPIPFTDGTGKEHTVNLWMHWAEFVFEEEFKDEKNRILMYGRSNRTANGEYQNMDKGGGALEQGAGLREQMSYGNVYYYNEFDLKLIEDILFELSTGVLGFGERSFIMETGERGAAKFSESIKNYLTGNSWLIHDLRLGGNPAVIQKTSSELHSNSLTAGFQFTEYKFANNISVKVIVNPIYDDTVRNKILHPLGGVAESYRYDIYYIGNPSQPNIQLAKVTGQEDFRGYQWGPFRNPFTGQANNNNASYDEDSAVFHRLAVLGAIVYDPMRTMSLIPAVLAG